MFFIVWGTKICRKKLGPVGHFCPVCRELTLFRAVTIKRVSHLYYVPLGRGERVAEEIECSACKLPLLFLPGSVRQAPEISPGAEIGALARATSPVGAAAILERTELETLARRGGLNPDQRRALLAEPFASVSYLVERARTGSQESITAVISLFAIVGVFATPLLWWSYADMRRPTWDMLAWCIGSTLATVILLAWAIHRRRTRHRRRVGRHAMKYLARALAPLRPRRDEIAATLSSLRIAGNPIGGAVDEMRLMDAIARLGDSPAAARQ